MPRALGLVGSAAFVGLLSVVGAAFPFGTKVDYPAGDGPEAVATGYFDDDDDLDLAVANGAGHSVSILLGNGDGTFGAKTDYATDLLPECVATGYLDGDADLDLAIANATGASVSILLGNGDGTFQARVDYETLFFSTSVTTGHFDGDADVDLAVANTGSHTVAILLGNGDGTFAASVYYATASNPIWVTTGHFDDDADLDLAVTASGDDSVSILLGNGDGTFAAKVDYATGNAPTSVTAGYFDDDADLDLAVANTSGASVSILLGNGDGTFATKVDYATGFLPRSVMAGHFDGDADLDLAVANTFSDSVSILPGNGDGTFATKVDHAAGDSPTSVTAGHFDDDLALDLAVANRDSDNVTVLLDTSPPDNGDFETVPPFPPFTTGDAPLALTTGYLDDDTDADLVVANLNGDDLTVLLGVGNGRFGPGSPVAAGDGPIAVATGYFDADADMDVAVADYDGDSVSILLGNGQGGFSPAPDSPFAIGDRPRSIATGHFDDDTYLDLAVAVQWGQTVSILLGRGDGTFAASTPITSTFPVQVITGHFDDDVDLDLAVLGEVTVSILLGDGAGAFVLAPGSPLSLHNVHRLSSIAVGHFDGDADLDLAVGHGNLGTVAILLGNGNGTFTAAPGSPFAAGGVTFDVVTGHFDDDADLDLAVGLNPQHISILAGNGDGTFAAPVLRLLSLRPEGIVTGYFDDDRALDIAFCNAANDEVMVLLAVPANRPPVADAGGDQTVECAGTPTAVALDGSGSSDLDEDALTYSWSEGGNVIGTGASPTVALSTGAHAITLTVTDPDGLTSTDEVTVAVVDTTAPVITLAGADPVTVECHSSFTDPGATALDACGGAVGVSSSGMVEVNTPGSYTVTYTATDGTNEAAATRTVDVVDSTAPTITLTTNVISLARAHHKYLQFDVTAFASGVSDGCDSALGVPDVVIASVSSDEPENTVGTGDGNTVNDIVIAPDCKSVQLRSERAESGNGRVYTVTLAVKDTTGNVATATRQVLVPVLGVPATDDGAAAGYTVDGCSP